MRATIYHSWNDPVLRLAFLCITLMGMAVAAIGPFQSIIGIEYLGFSPATYALITILGALFSVAASVAVGIYTDQTGRYKTVLARCNFVGIIAAASVFFLPSKATFILAHVFLFPIGATTFTQYFAMASLAANTNDKLDKDVSLSFVRAAFSGAYGLAPPLLAIAVAGGMDLLTVYGLTTVVNMIVLALILRMWPERQLALSEKSGIGLFESLKELARTSVLIRLLLIAVIVGVNGLYNILLGLLILNDLGGSESDVGLFAGGVALTEVPVMLAAAVVLRYVTRSGMILIGCLIYGAFLAGLAAYPSMDAVWIMIIPGGIGAGILLSLTVGYVQDLVAIRPGAGSSLVAVSHFGGAMLSAAVFAGGALFTGYQGTAWIGACIGICAGIVLFMIDGATLRPRKTAP